MANKHPKRGSPSPAIREMQTKTTLRYHYTLTTMAKIKKQWDFPGGSVAKTLHSQCTGPGLDLWSGN